MLEFACKDHFSFLCKSLCWGRDLVRRGVRWQIGEGNLRAYSTPWLPRTGAFSLLSEEPEDGYPWRVADFMKDGCWNRDLLEALLSPYDVEEVLKIPLGAGTNRDKLVWHFEEDGNYSVRSGYRLARSEGRGGPSCSVSDEPRWWTRLWRLQIPPKVKHIVWRVWFDALPTYGNLRGRGVACLPFCAFCGALPEDALHAVWGCERARDLWENSSLQRWAEKTGPIPLKEICLRAMDSLPDKDLDLFCGIIWAAWTDRNLRLFDHYMKRPEVWVCEVASWLASFKDCSRRAETTPSGKPARQTVWTAPDSDSLKLNVDAAWDARSRRASIGCVVRNQQGEVLGVMASAIEGVDSALTAECKAIWGGLRFIQTRGWTISSVESDCLRATQLVRGRHLNGLQGPVIADIVAVEAELRLPFTYRWVPRSCNEPANCIAKARMNFVSSDFVSFQCLAWLENCIQKDISFLVQV